MSNRALIVVDVQHDFADPDGALYVPGGEQVATDITTFVRRNLHDYDLIVASRDWHNPPPDTNDGHFLLWPPHCVAGSKGAEFHRNLTLPWSMTTEIRKGQGTGAYSVFDGATPAGDTLTNVLLSNGVKYVDIVGLALDYCVLATAMDAVRGDFDVTVNTDLVAGVTARTTIDALTEMTRAGVHLGYGMH